MPNVDNSKLHLYNCYFDINKFNEPYSDYNDYLEDLRYLVDSYVNAIFRIRKSNFREKTSYLALRGIVITDDEVDNAIMASMVDKRNVSVGNDIKQSLIVCWDHIKNRVAMSDGFFNLENFFNVHNCSFITKLAIIFSLISEVDRKYERLFGYLQDDNNMKKPTLGLVFACAKLTYNISLQNAMELLDNKITSLIFDDITSYELPCFLSKGLKLRKLAVDFFIGSEADSFVQSSVCTKFYPEQNVDNIIINEDINQKLILETEKIIANKLPNSIIHLYGAVGSGKRLQVKHVGKKLNKIIFFVNLKYLLQYDSKIYLLLTNIYLEAFLKDGLICFYNCDLDIEYQSSLEFILHDVFKYFNLVFLLNEKFKYFEALTNCFLPTVNIKIDLPNVNDSVEVWKFNSKNYKISDDINFKQFSNKFKYTAGQIKDILNKASIEASIDNGVIDSELLLNVCRKYAVHNLDKRATLINCNFTFNDLVIDNDQRDILINACNYVKFKDVVYEDWGFKEKVPYGRGLSILLYGPPGTGKTMGAQVIANELGLELYKIDISQIINKYIGETEKNLGDIFLEAKKSNAILLFDEADSLFGKRTDVKDSNDKNSNNETSYLLQKMEEYEGVSILTTNKFNNFDDAFRRRIRFIVNFKMPDSEMRRQLWNKIFPKKAPLGKDFDDWFLAENFELSGSSIKSIAILASYLALAEKSDIMMKHILVALKYEYQKMGKIIAKKDMGMYGDMF